MPSFSRGPVRLGAITVNTVEEVAQLPDGTLIMWRPYPPDPSSESVAFVRRTDRETSGNRAALFPQVWISPGNGWGPESIHLLTFPVHIILLGIDARPHTPLPETVIDQLDQLDSDDVEDIVCQGAGGPVGTAYADVTGGLGQPGAQGWPEQGLLTDFDTQTLITGGTYPRDIALQAAAQIFQNQGDEYAATAENVTAMADHFVDWLIEGSKDVDPEDAHESEPSGDVAVMSIETATSAMTRDLKFVTSTLGLSARPVNRIAKMLAGLGWTR